MILFRSSSAFNFFSTTTSFHLSGNPSNIHTLFIRFVILVIIFILRSSPVVFPFLTFLFGSSLLPVLSSLWSFLPAHSQARIRVSTPTFLSFCMFCLSPCINFTKYFLHSCRLILFVIPILLLCLLINVHISFMFFICSISSFIVCSSILVYFLCIP